VRYTDKTFRELSHVEQFLYRYLQKMKGLIITYAYLCEVFIMNAPSLNVSTLESNFEARFSCQFNLADATLLQLHSTRKEM